MSSKPKIIAVVGPTASGKTSLSIKLALKFKGEVISADSRQVYRGLDLGSGKVTSDEMLGVPHHLIDIADPNDVYSGANFKHDASNAVEAIVERNNVPIIAGGTFFYLDILRGKIQAAPVEPNSALREELEKLSTDQLFNELEKKDSARASDIDEHNRVRLIRALEIVETLGHVPPTVRPESEYEWLILGIDTDLEKLRENIHKRLMSRFDAGMLEEAKQLHADGLSFERMESLGLEYRYMARHLKGEISYDEMLKELETKIRQFAKRQKTWLKRDTDIKWYTLEDESAVFAEVQKFLSDSVS